MVAEATDVGTAASAASASAAGPADGPAPTTDPDAGLSTRDRLLDEGERLFARDGVDRVASRRIVEAAGQRNVSAISYHFGSREGLVLAILARRGGPVDAERGRRRDGLAVTPSATDLVACLVEPYLALSADAGGRSYLRIVAQLRGRFAAWRVESDAATTAHMARILDEIEARAPGTAAQRQERVIAMIMLMTGMAAERARRIDEGMAPGTDHGVFVADLTAMCAAVAVAPIAA